MCRWYGGARVAAVLMIDDLSDAYMDIGEIGLHPSNDWGHGGLGENGIFRFFEDNFLAAHPEVKYTVFLPFGKHSAVLAQCGYVTHAADAFSSESFRSLLRHIAASGNEIAYHGHHHGAAEPVVKVGNLDTERDFVAAEDAADACIRMIQGSSWGEVFNICSGRPVKVREIVELALSCSDRPVRLEVDPALVRPADVAVIYGSWEKANRAFGFEPANGLEESIKAAWNCAMRPPEPAGCWAS